MQSKRIMKRITKIIFSLIMISISIPISAQEIIQMKKETSGIYTIPCEVNGLKLRFIFDTGASTVSISLTEASFMLKNGYLNDADIKGTANVQTANGKIDENYLVNLKELKIGSVILKNVQAVVSSSLDAPLLLGQSVLDQLGHWSFNHSTLVLNDLENSSDSTYTWDEIEEMCNNPEKRHHTLEILEPYVLDDVNMACYLFLSNAPFDDKYRNNLSKDQYITKAITNLEKIDEKDANDIFWDYEKLVWFYSYHINDNSKAIDYFSKCEKTGKLSIKQLDEICTNLMLHMGWDTRKIDTEFATDCFRKGYYNSYRYYASYLKEIKESPVKAFQAYKKLSDIGYLPASIELGICYLEGIGTTKNTAFGLSLLKKGAEGGIIKGIKELCRRYYYGYTLKKDLDEVLKYAKLFGRNNKTCEILQDAYTGIAFFNQKEYRYAFSCLSRLEQYGDLVSRENINIFNSGINNIYDEVLVALGQMYENGLGCKPDFDKAYVTYTKLADVDPALGYGCLGDLFFLNELVQSDSKRAYQYYVLGANNNSSYCCYRLALMYYYGEGADENHVRANEYKQKAIKSGDYTSADFKF